jgi:hypothetical protein
LAERAAATELPAALAGAEGLYWVWTMRRDSTSSCIDSANNWGRVSSGLKPGMAWRTSSGFFCQWRFMNCWADRPPSNSWAASTEMAAAEVAADEVSGLADEGVLRVLMGQLSDENH